MHMEIKHSLNGKVETFIQTHRAQLYLYILSEPFHFLHSVNLCLFVWVYTVYIFIYVRDGFTNFKKEKFNVFLRLKLRKYTIYWIFTVSTTGENTTNHEISGHRICQNSTKECIFYRSKSVNIKYIYFFLNYLVACVYRGDKYTYTCNSRKSCHKHRTWENSLNSINTTHKQTKESKCKH